LRLDLVDIEPGYHCLLGAILETEEPLLEHGFPDHSPVVLVRLQVGNDDRDHCVPPKPSESELVFHPQVGFDCGGRPSIVTAAEEIPEFASAAVQLTGCPHSQAVLLVGPDGEVDFGPIEVPPAIDSGTFFYGVRLSKGVFYRAMTMPLIPPGEPRPSFLQPFTSYPGQVRPVE
jgi:hypothetical protein